MASEKAHAGADGAADEILFAREWRNPNPSGLANPGHITFTLDARFRSRSRLAGQGSMAGVRAYVAILDEAVATFGRDRTTTALVDLTELRDPPLRAQLVLGKWLLSHRKQVERVAVFGGRPIEMKVAQFVMTLARIDGVGFFQDEAAAVRFLGW